METNPIRITRSAIWMGLRFGHLEGPANRLICAFVPRVLHDRLLADEQARNHAHDAAIVRGLGYLTLDAVTEKTEIDLTTLDPVWQAVKAKDSGVEFTQVFDPHAAAALEKITPAPTPRSKRSRP